MSTMLVSTADTKEQLVWDPADKQAVSKVKEEFDKIVGSGTAFAYKESPAGKEQIKSFDPAAEKIVVGPRLVGG